MKKIQKSEEEWKKILPPKSYNICREKGTEAPFQNEYWDCHDPGIYHCKACGQELFNSEDKYDSGTGWPSFTKPIQEESVQQIQDSSHNMKRIEVLCNRCGSHLGHLFEDGPKPLGKRYCINSGALQLS